MSKKTTMDALERFYKRQMPENAARQRRKNGAPERECVKLLCAWMKDQGWSYDIVEASTYDRFTGSVGEAKVAAGFSDIVACIPPLGTAGYIEAKAKGRRSTLKDHQRFFLEQKIECGAFAVCVDCPELLNEFWLKYTSIKSSGQNTKEYLLGVLPRKKKVDDVDLF